MAIDIHKLLPAGYRFRELWRPHNIVGTKCPTSVAGGHPLTLTGALKGSTVNGLKMRGAELITITDHADIHIADNLTVVLPAFILRTTFDSTAAADMAILDLNGLTVIARLNSTTGALDVILNDSVLGATTISTTKVSWAANTVWQVAFTLNSALGTDEFKFFINGVAENTSGATNLNALTVNAGNTRIGYDGTTYFTGRFQRMVLIYDTVVLTEARLLMVYKGYPYDVNLKAYLPMDCPGRGLTITDRSTGGNCSGTISGTNTAAIWDFDARKLVALNPDMLNDQVASSNGVDISGDLSLVWAGKMKSTYNALGTADAYLVYPRVDASNHLILQYRDTGNIMRWLTVGSGTSVFVTSALKPAIGDYWIMIGTITMAGAIEFFINGSSVGTNTGAGVISGAAAIAHIGGYLAGTYDISEPVLIGIIDGALSPTLAKKLTEAINKRLNLGLTI